MNSLTIRQGQVFTFPAKINNRGKFTLHSTSIIGKEGVTCAFVRAFVLTKGIQFSCSKYRTSDDFHFNKLSSAQEVFILRMDEISDSDGGVLMVDTKHSATHAQNFFVNLLSSSDEFTFFASKGSYVKSMEVIIPFKWFLNYTDKEFSYSFLKNYLLLRARKLQAGFNNSSFKKIFLDVINNANREDLELDLIEKKIISLLSIAFSGLTLDLCNFIESQKVKISDDEIKRLITVRKVLDTVLLPPTFASLTKMALMSSTSLKTKFKKMYGTTVFEYFQRMRMHRARILLLTHKYSIKQIGRQLGYSNLSNFAIAFKKEFNQLPHELIKEM